MTDESLDEFAAQVIAGLDIYLPDADSAREAARGVVREVARRVFARYSIPLVRAGVLGMNVGELLTLRRFGAAGLGRPAFPDIIEDRPQDLANLVRHGLLGTCDRGYFITSAGYNALRDQDPASKPGEVLLLNPTAAPDARPKAHASSTGAAQQEES